MARPTYDQRAPQRTLPSGITAASPANGGTLNIGNNAAYPTPPAGGIVFIDVDFDDASKIETIGYTDLSGLDSIDNITRGIGKNGAQDHDVGALIRLSLPDVVAEQIALQNEPNVFTQDQRIKKVDATVHVEADTGSDYGEYRLDYQGVGKGSFWYDVPGDRVELSSQAAGGLDLASSNGVFVVGRRLAVEKIAEVFPGGTSADIDFDNIPQFYKTLILKGSWFIPARPVVRMNGDSGSNYAFAYFARTASTTVALGSNADGGIPLGSQNHANAGSVELWLPSYSSSQLWKAIHGTYLTLGNGNPAPVEGGFVTGIWRPNAIPITRVVASSLGETWGTGSHVELLGVR